MLLSAVCVRVCVYRCSIKYKKGWHKIGLVAVKIKHPMDLRLHWSYLVADKHKRMFSTLNPRAYASLASHLKKSIRCEFFCTDFFDIHCNMMSAKGLNFSMAILNLSTHIQCTQHNTNTFNCMLKHLREYKHTRSHTHRWMKRKWTRDASTTRMEIIIYFLEAREKSGETSECGSAVSDDDEWERNAKKQYFE